MTLLSVNTGRPRTVSAGDRKVRTSIWKSPREGRVAVRTLNLDGDRQADLNVHGGKDKAVYCYPLSHYDFWKKELPGRDLPIGMFGENFTIDFSSNGYPEGIGSIEQSIHIGDRFSIGSAEVVVTQPRLPCYKLGVKFQLDDMVKRFLASGRTGFYLAVTREDEVGAGDEFKALAPDPSAVPVSEITRLYIAKKYSAADAHMVQRALQVAALPESWKDYFRQRLEMMKVDS